MTTTGARTTLPQRLGEALAALGAARVDADLVEREEPVDQAHVPVRGAARADVAEHLRVGASEMSRADRRDGAGAHVGQARRVDHRDGCARRRVEQAQEPQLRRQPARVVVEVVADDLDARQTERRDVAAQDVEVPAQRGIGLEVDARLDRRLAASLRAQGVLDGVEDLVVRECELLDLGPAEPGQLERRAGILHQRVPAWPSPASRARTIASARSATCSFVKMFETWLRIVFGLSTK